LSLISGKVFPYLDLGVVFASFIVCTLRQNCPSARLDLFKNAIAVVEEILTHVKTKCMRDYLTLAEIETRFLRYVIPVAGIEGSNLIGSRQDKACGVQTPLPLVGDAQHARLEGWITSTI
jgi:hypothetical protein